MGKGAGPELNHPGWEGRAQLPQEFLFGSVGRPAAAFTCSLESWQSSFGVLVAEVWPVVCVGVLLSLHFSQPLQGLS